MLRINKRYARVMLCAFAAVAVPLLVLPWLFNIGQPESVRVHNLTVVGSPWSWTLAALLFAFLLAASGKLSVNRSVIPRKVRLLVGLAGFLSGVALISFTWAASISSIPLIMGAIIQPKLPRVGRWLISVTAPILSTWVIPLGGVFWFEAARVNPFRPFELVPVMISAAWMLSPILLIWCDGVLLLEAFVQRRSPKAS